MSTPKRKKTESKPAPEPEADSRTLEEAEDRMFDYLWNGTVDGEVYDGDPADLDFF